MSGAERLAAARARLSRRAMDVALSEGSDPVRSCALAARARQLTSPRGRRTTAEALERLALTIEGPAPRATVRPSRPAVSLNRELLLELAQELRGSRPVYAGGVAALELVVRDGTGPAYTDRRGEWLAAELLRAQRGLHGANEPAPRRADRLRSGPDERER